VYKIVRRFSFAHRLNRIIIKNNFFAKLSFDKKYTIYAALKTNSKHYIAVHKLFTSCDKKSISKTIDFCQIMLFNWDILFKQLFKLRRKGCCDLNICFIRSGGFL